MTSLTLDTLNRTTQVAKTGVATETYAYDDSGRRIRKVAGTVTSNYLYQGEDLYAEYGTAYTAPTAVYTHGPATDDPLLRLTGTIGPNATASYYHQDGLGSVVGFTNATGGTLASRRYDAWGNVTATTGTLPQYGYTGREPDATGLVYYRARYYDPSQRRFTQRDPIGFKDGINRYAYVGNNPINLVDPEGTLAFFWHAGISYTAARDSGYGVTDSVSMAWNAMAVDFREGSQSAMPNGTVQHAMRGTFEDQERPQTSAQAATATRDYINFNVGLNTNLSLGSALHATQDAATPLHQGHTWDGWRWDINHADAWSNNVDVVHHLTRDVFPSSDTIRQVYTNSRDILPSPGSRSGSSSLPQPFNIQSPQYGYLGGNQSLGSFTSSSPSSIYSGTSNWGINPRAVK